MNAYDYLVLHRNINRIVGNEIIDSTVDFGSNFDIKRSIQDLITHDYMYISKEPESSLQKLKVPELKQLLRNNNLKIGGNKPELIERILDNYNNMEIDIELPQIYIPTEKGLRLIEQTQYIPHFARDFSISFARAVSVAHKNLNSEDTIEFIYLHEIKRNLQKRNIDELSLIVNRLSNYYKNYSADSDKIRKYCNVAHYISVIRYYDFSNSVFYFPLTEQILTPYESKEYYENLLLLDKVKSTLFIELYIRDVKDFFNEDMPFSELFANFIVSYIYDDKDMQSSLFNHLKKHVKQKDVGRYTITADIFREELVEESSSYQKPDNKKSREISSKPKAHYKNKINPPKDKNNQPDIQDSLYGCGCLLLIVLFIGGCNAILF
ncbi:SAP domain-containing protein [Staphylococcus chromogenes]|uniref:SAP domain-containing protein n=1 Tax=Staphylococcus chromogenes TaxID=46126 RepID=UPI003B005049